MKKILIMMLSVFMLNANDFVSVDCNAFNEVYLQLKGIGKKCEVSTDIHTFTQEIDKNIAGTIRYEDGEEVPFVTNNNVFNANIEQDRKFQIKVGNFTSVFLKLSILSDGSESWKYLKELTRRWNKYPFQPIFTTTVEVNTKFLNEDKTPVINTRVQLVNDIFVGEALTDTNGSANILIPINTPFVVRAWNPILDKWSTYENAFKVNINKEATELINGQWVDSNKTFSDGE